MCQILSLYKSLFEYPAFCSRQDGPSIYFSVESRLLHNEFSFNVNCEWIEAEY